MRPRIRAVLFDLDGTLVDSAPDLMATLAWLRRSQGLADLEHVPPRYLAARGALGMIEAGFGDRPDLDRDALRKQFIEHYAAHLWVGSRAYEGVDEVLDGLVRRGLGLGVVTNKLGYLAQAVIRAAGWNRILSCVIGGDTTLRAKPHPAPVLEACRRLSVHPGEALMVGDDPRDIEAGRRAGSRTAVAAWGYLQPGSQPSEWGAQAVFQTPMEITNKVMEINES